MENLKQLLELRDKVTSLEKYITESEKNENSLSGLIKEKQKELDTIRYQQFKVNLTRNRNSNHIKTCLENVINRFEKPPASSLQEGDKNNGDEELIMDQTLAELHTLQQEINQNTLFINNKLS